MRTQQTPITQDADNHLVTQPERISSILNEIRFRLVLVGVRIDPNGPLYNSLLVRLDPDTQKVYLDELNLFDTHAPLDVGTDLHIYASLRGIAIRFSLTVEMIIIEDEKTLYCGSYPTQINYLQRRDVFRVALPPHERRRVTLQYNQLEVTVRLIDLSIKGFCVGTVASTFEDVPLRARFHYSNMDLPGLRTPLSGHALLVNLRPAPQPGIISAGFSIIDSDPQTERALMRAALHYQRDARKKAE